MHTDRDDDALSWDGDDDPTLHSAASRAARATGAPAVAGGDDPLDAGLAPVGSAADETAPGELSSAALVALGLFGGVYLLYTLGWIIGGLRLQGVARFLVSDAAFLPFLWVAVAAPALWFGATYLLTRSTRSWVRFAWLIGGALLLVPWPLLMIGAGA